MKKYQKLVKDNFDLIVRAEDALSHAIDNDDEVPIFAYSSVYITAGALLVIESDEKYDFNKLDRAAANNFARCLESYARYGNLSHECTMRCFTLAEQIKANTHYHLRKEILAN